MNADNTILVIGSRHDCKTQSSAVYQHLALMQSVTL